MSIDIIEHPILGTSALFSILAFLYINIRSNDSINIIQKNSNDRLSRLVKGRYRIFVPSNK